MYSKFGMDNKMGMTLDKRNKTSWKYINTKLVLMETKTQSNRTNMCMYIP